MLLKYIIYSLIFSFCFAENDETFLFCKSLPPKLINGLIKRDRVSYYNGQGYLGNMEYMCLPGFNQIGNKIVTCENGIWSTMPQCISKKRCSPVRNYPLNTIVESDNITFFQNDPKQIVVGSIVNLRCIENYEFDPTASGSLIIQCQNDGSWSTMPTCRVGQSTCDYSKLYLPSRSRITRMNFKFSETNREYHMIGSNLEYACEDGYRLNDGKTSLIVECLSSGSWSSLPVCELIYETKQTVRCNYPTGIQNGFLTLYNVTIWEDQTYTGNIVYECNYGFETLFATDQIISECINGTWAYVSDCQEIPTCPKQDLLKIESQVENSYVHNVSLQYIRDPLVFVYNSYVLRICLPGFEHDPLSPPLKIQCQRNSNTWTGIPICRAIQTATQIMTIDNASENEEWIPSDNLFLLQENFTTSSNINKFEPTNDVTTERSTVLVDTTHTIVCNSNNIPSVPNSVITHSELNTTYTVGTTLHFTCQAGYEPLLNQSSFTICLVNGSWSTDALNITTCRLRDETTEVIVLDTSTMTSNTTEQTNTAMNLDENLPIMNISTDASISITQSMPISNRQVRQAKSTCKQIPHIDHAQLLIDDTMKNNETTYSGSLSFICQYGFISDIKQNEPFRITCQNGEFHPKVICIEQPRCSLPPPIDSTRSSVVTSLVNVFDTSTNEAIPGSFILLSCVDKTNDKTSIFNMTCLDNGQWLLPPPPCKAPFKRQCQSGITIPNARTQVYAKLTPDGYYNDGSKAIYRCLENFIHDQESGPLHIQCRNGRWGPRPRCIPNGCLEPMPETIENGWKSAETYVIQGDLKYYLLTRYSCHANAIMVDSSARVIDIECRNSEWQHKSMPVCQLQE